MSARSGRISLRDHRAEAPADRPGLLSFLPVFRPGAPGRMPSRPHTLSSDARVTADPPMYRHSARSTASVEILQPERSSSGRDVALRRWTPGVGGFPRASTPASRGSGPCVAAGIPDASSLLAEHTSARSAAQRTGQRLRLRTATTSTSPPTTDG